MIPESGEFPEIDRAVKAMVAICPEHTVDGIAVTDLDCGACGARQDACRAYFSMLVDDAVEAMKL